LVEEKRMVIERRETIRLVDQLDVEDKGVEDAS